MLDTVWVKTKWAIIFLTGCLLFVPPVAGETFKAGILDFRPFYFVESMDKISGTLYEVLVKTMEKAGLDFSIRGYPPKRLYTQLAYGDTDIFIGIKKVPIYQDNVLFSKAPVTAIKLGIYSLPGTRMLENIQGLTGQKVIVIAGYGYGGYKESFLTRPESNIDLMETTKHKNAFRMLKAQRGGFKYLLDYERPSNEALKKVKIPGIQVVQVFNLDVFFIVSKKTRNAQQVMIKLEQAYEQLKASGDIE